MVTGFILIVNVKIRSIWFLINIQWVNLWSCRMTDDPRGERPDYVIQDFFECIPPIIPPITRFIKTI